MGKLGNSPLAIFRQHLERSELAYQVAPENGAAVFFPRVACPRTGNESLEWRISAGLGTVYATTTVHAPQTPPYNVALVDLDEGFRMMTRIEGVATEAVTIGMRVKFLVHRPGGDEAPYPVFVPA